MNYDDATLLHLVYAYAAQFSDDPSTQNAAVLVKNHIPYVATFAVNSLPQHIADTPQRWERPHKYAVVEHAERNAIYQAARHGIRTKGLTMICPWAACADCARGIIQSGITRLVIHQKAFLEDARWTDSVHIGHQLLAEAGITITYYDGDIGCHPIRRDGTLWQP